jgi:hypothetical protein
VTGSKTFGALPWRRPYSNASHVDGQRLNPGGSRSGTAAENYKEIMKKLPR